MGPGLRPGPRLGRRGAAALEFVLATPLMIILLGGSADFGLAMYSRATLANAVAAGAEYAYLTGTGVTLASIQNVVTRVSGLNAANLSFTGSSAPGPYCMSGSPPTLVVAAGGWGTTCGTGTQVGDSQTAGTFVKIVATYTNYGLMGGFRAASSYTVSETATVMLK